MNKQAMKWWKDLTLDAKFYATTEFKELLDGSSGHPNLLTEEEITLIYCTKFDYKQYTMNESTKKAFEIFREGFEAALETLGATNYTQDAIDEAIDKAFDVYSQKLLGKQ